FPEAECFKEELQRLEKRLLKKLKQEIRQTRVKKMKHRMDAFRQQLHAAHTADWQHYALVRLRRRLDKAFARGVAQRRKILPADPLTIHRTRVAFKKFRYMVEQLQPLLPGLSDDLLDRLREYQKLMGDIQDCETLLTTLDKFLSEEKGAGRPLKQFRLATQHDYAVLIAKYLRRADEVFTFWKPATTAARAKP
ncbi:MAG TPA: CHAD domain-containing protein, partial [Verrucomicrobiae bacterium]|nr:CHAD domain-containing protein [Verrucomicrobiae bacterium]